MGYANESKQLILAPETAWMVPVTVSTTGDKVVCRVLEACTVLRIGILVTTAFTVTALVADFDKRVTPGSDTGRIDQGVGRITAPAAAQAIGVLLYKDVAVDLNAGDEIMFAVNTAPTAGAGIPIMVVVARHTVPAENADYVKSS